MVFKCEILTIIFWVKSIFYFMDFFFYFMNDNGFILNYIYFIRLNIKLSKYFKFLN
jgi:hypothetical protein